MMRPKWVGLWTLSIVISVAAVSTGMFLENTVEKSYAYERLASNEFTLEMWCSIPQGSLQSILSDLKNLTQVDDAEGMYSDDTPEDMENFQEVKIFMRINSTYLMNSRGLIEIQQKLKKVGEDASGVIESHGGMVEEMEYPTGVSYYWWVPYMPLLNGLNIGLLTIIFCIYAGAVGLEAKIWAMLGEDERDAYSKRKIVFRIDRLAEYVPDLGIVAILTLVGYIFGMLVMWAANELFYHLPTFKPGIYLDEMAICLLIAILMLAAIGGMAKRGLRKRALIWRFRDLPTWSDEYIIKRALTFTLFPVIAGVLIAKGPLLRGGVCLLCILFLHISVAAFIISVTSLSWLATINMERLRGWVHQWLFGPVRNRVCTNDVCLRGCLRRDLRISRYVAAASLLMICVVFLSAVPDTLYEVNRLDDITRVGGDVKVYLSEYSNMTQLYEILSDDRLVLSYSFIAYPPTDHTGWLLFKEEVTYMDMPWFGVTDFKAYSASIYDINAFIREGELKKGCAVVSERFALLKRLAVGDVVSTAAGDFVISGIMYRIPGVDAYVLIDSPHAMFNVSHQDVIIKARDASALKAELDSREISYESLGSEKRTPVPDFSFHLFYLIPTGYLLLCVLHLSICSDYASKLRDCMVKHGRASIRETVLLDGMVLVIGAAFTGLISGLSFACFMLLVFTMWWLLPTFTLGPLFLLFIPLLFVAYLFGTVTAAFATTRHTTD